MSFFGQVGEGAVVRVRAASYLAAVVWTILRKATQRRYWVRTSSAVLARQILFTGVEAMRFVSLVALITGISVVVQAQVWLGKTGQSNMLGPLLVMVIIREVAPLLVNFIVIGRSGAAIATELANMKVMGEIRVLDAQGIDSLLYLAMPRVIAMAVSIFCLTIWFILVSFAGGYASGILAGLGGAGPLAFLQSVLKGLHSPDVYAVLAKTLIPGALTAIICVMEGLAVDNAITAVPQAATRAVVRSIGALFIVSAIVSILLYV